MKILISTVAFLIAIQSHAQFHKHPELKELDKKLDITLDSAAKHMIMFVLVKKESDYETAMKYTNEADSLNKVFLQSCQKNKIKLDEYQVNGRYDEINSFRNKKLKEDILKENKKTASVRFRHQKYEIGPKAKTYFDQFSEYLPAH